MKRLLAACLLALAGCGPVEAPGASEPTLRTDEIVGGTFTTGDPNVFMLVSQDASGQLALCTATLIGSRTLLTAAHCVDPQLNTNIQQVIASNAPSLDQVIPGINTWSVLETRMDPHWSPFTLEGDIATALLEADPGVAPKGWNRAPLISGEAVRSVGYGTTGNNAGEGYKRTVDLMVNQVGPTHLFLGNGVDKGICHGDSGGPTFHTFPDGVERVVGVHSYTLREDCTEGAATRVDAFAPFIDSWLADKEPPSCTVDGRCAPSCPQVDADCRGDGQACTSGSQCAGQRCVTDPQHPDAYCSKPCSAGCGPGAECDGSGACRFVQLPQAAVGEPCTPGGTFCGLAGVCTGSASGVTKCEVACASAADCQPDFSCASGLDGQRYCLEPNRAPIVLRKASIEGRAAPGCSTGLGLVPALGVLLWLRRRKPST